MIRLRRLLVKYEKYGTLSKDETSNDITAACREWHRKFFFNINFCSFLAMYSQSPNTGKQQFVYIFLGLPLCFLGFCRERFMVTMK